MEKTAGSNKKNPSAKAQTRAVLRAEDGGRAFMVEMAKLARKSLQQSSVDSIYTGEIVYLLTGDRHLEIKINGKDKIGLVTEVSMLSQNEEGQTFEKGIDAFIEKGLEDPKCLGFVPADENVQKILTQKHNLTPVVLGETITIDSGDCFRAIVLKVTANVPKRV